MGKTKEHSKPIWSERLVQALEAANRADYFHLLEEEADAALATLDLDESSVTDTLERGYELCQMAAELGPKGQLFIGADYETGGSTAILAFVGRSEDEVMERLWPIIKEGEMASQVLEQKKRQFPQDGTIAEMIEAVALLALEKDREMPEERRHFPHSWGSQVADQIELIRKKAGVKARIRLIRPQKGRVETADRYDSEQEALRALFDTLVCFGLSGARV